MQTTAPEDKEHNVKTNPDSNDPGAVCLPPPVQVEAGKGAIDRYGVMLETSAVATAFSVMSSNRASHGERLEAAKLALDMIGKRTPAQSAPPTPGITLQLIAPVQNAFRGIADVVDVLDRTKRVDDASTKVSNV